MIVFCTGLKIKVPSTTHYHREHKWDSGEFITVYSKIPDDEVKASFPKDEIIEIFMDYHLALTHRIKNTATGDDIAAPIITSATAIFAIRIDPEFLTDEKNKYFIPLKNIKEILYADFLADEPDCYGRFIDFQNTKKNKYHVALFKPVKSERKPSVQSNANHRAVKIIVDNLLLLEVYCSGYFRNHKTEANLLKDKLLNFKIKKEETPAILNFIFNSLLDEYYALAADKRSDDYGSMLSTAIQYLETGTNYQILAQHKAFEVLNPIILRNLFDLVFSYLKTPEIDAAYSLKP